MLKLALTRDRDFVSVTVTSSFAVLVVAIGAYALFGTSAAWEVTATVIGLMLLSGLSLGFSQLCYSQALEHGPVSVVVPLYALSPMLTVIFGIVVLRETLTMVQVTGVVLAIVSTFLLSMEDPADEKGNS